MTPDTLWMEKHHAEKAMNEARKRLSEAQKEFAKTRSDYQRAQLRWMESAERGARPWTVEGAA